MVRREIETAFLTGLVYFGQGAVGIAGIALPLHLRSLNWTIEEITTVTSLVAMPWVFKIVYGLVSDTFPFLGYRRKSYLVLCCLLSALGWLCLSLSGGAKAGIIFSLFLGNFGFAATDVITDGLIVEHSTQRTSPIFQGIAWGSRSVGAIFSGIAGGWLAANWEPAHVYLLTVTLPLLVLIPVLWLEETKRERGPFKNVVEPIKKCFGLIVSGNIRWFLLMLVIFSAAASFSVPFFFHMKETLQFKETFLGVLVSLGQGGALLGSLIYLKFLKTVPPQKILTWAMVISALNIFATLLIFNTTSALAVVLIGGILGYLAILPIMSAAAILTHNSGVEGTLFAVLMGIYNLGQIVFGFIGGKVYSAIGLQTLIVITGCLMFMGLFAVRPINFGATQVDGELT